MDQVEGSEPFVGLVMVNVDDPFALDKSREFFRDPFQVGAIHRDHEFKVGLDAVKSVNDFIRAGQEGEEIRNRILIEDLDFLVLPEMMIKGEAGAEGISFGILMTGDQDFAGLFNFSSDFLIQAHFARGFF